MISIDSEHYCLLELLKASLFGLKPSIPEGVDWEKVFESAKTQCVVPLLTATVPKENRNMWADIAYRSKAYFMQMIYEQNSLVNLFSKNNIPYVILKGTAAAIYYPNPLQRTFGDIDIYISEEDLEFARKILNDNRYLYVSNDDRHYSFEKNGMDIELHSRFSCDRYNDIDYAVLQGLNNAVIYRVGGHPFSALPTYENGLVLLGHIMQHLKSLGIGLRQIIDWMMFVHRELDDSSWENHFKQLAVEAGLETLAKTVTYMCRKWLGLPGDITWCNDADEDVADQLLIRILDDGNFGQDRAPFEIVKKSMREEGVFSYLQRAGIENWPLTKKCAVLRPFAWIYQLCKYICMGIANLFTRKKLFMKVKHKMSLEELWKRLE